jgi:hypothetical protein
VARQSFSSWECYGWPLPALRVAGRLLLFGKMDLVPIPADQSGPPQKLAPAHIFLSAVQATIERSMIA